jgi:hypothetical protein
MYRVLLRELDYAEDPDISALEIELEKEGKLAAFQDLCRAEYKEEWRKIRNGSRKLRTSSTILHRLDPGTYAATDTWLNMVNARSSKRLSVEDLVERLVRSVRNAPAREGLRFHSGRDGSIRRAGRRTPGNLRAVVEQFGKESLERMKAGRIPGPAWIDRHGPGKAAGGLQPPRSRPHRPA